MHKRNKETNKERGMDKENIIKNKKEKQSREIMNETLKGT